jgi:hypothetical protein
MLQLFRKHPAEAGETYGQHLVFTLKMAARFSVLAVLSVIHGFLPFLFCRASSSECEKIARIYQSRSRR